MKSAPADKFNAPCLSVQVSGNKTSGGRLSGIQASFFNITNSRIRFSAIKRAAGSENIVVRMYNPTEQVQKTDVLFGENTVDAAWICNLNEERQMEVECSGNGIVKVEFAPKKILTLEIKLS